MSDGATSALPQSVEDRQLELELRKVEIEIKRLALDEARYRHEQSRSIVREHLPAILTFATTIASLLIAALTLILSDRAEKRRAATEENRMQQASVQKNVELAATMAENERRLRHDLLEFTTQESTVILGNDEAAKARIAGVMMACFPAELVQPLFERLEGLGRTPAATHVWRASSVQAATLAIAEASGYAKFGHMTNGVWDEHLFRIVNGQAKAIPERGDVIQVLRETNLRSGFPIDRPGVGLIYMQPTRVIPPKTLAKVLDVRIYRDRHVWVQIVPNQ